MRRKKKKVYHNPVSVSGFQHDNPSRNNENNELFLGNEQAKKQQRAKKTNSTLTELIKELIN